MTEEVKVIIIGDGPDALEAIKLLTKHNIGHIVAESSVVTPPWLDNVLADLKSADAIDAVLYKEPKKKEMFGSKKRRRNAT